MALMSGWYPRVTVMKRSTLRRFFLWLSVLVATAYQSWIQLVGFSRLSTAPAVTDEQGSESNVDQRVKVFILAGQSNMGGRGSMVHLDTLMKGSEAENDEFRRALWDGNGYKTRDDVFVQWRDSYGNLTPGLFNRSFGPELMFGWKIGDVFQQKILLIKTAYGGRSLAVDFRPPSSGQGNYTGRIVSPGISPDGYRHYYNEMIHEIHQALQQIEFVVPDYNSSAGYTVEGMVWFQGWGDVGNHQAVDEYSRNLGNLIRDVRVAVSVPGLPVVIGELGMHGHDLENLRYDAKKRVLDLRAAQQRVTQQEEFQNNTIFVRTAPFAVLGRETFDQFFHYNGRADTFLQIGRSFADGMLALLR